MFTLALPTPRSGSDDGQALAPAETTAFEHGTAGGSQHAFEEAVFPLTWDAFRLVGTLGHKAWFLGESCQMEFWRISCPTDDEGTSGELPPVYQWARPGVEVCPP